MKLIEKSDSNDGCEMSFSSLDFLTYSEQLITHQKSQFIRTSHLNSIFSQQFFKIDWKGEASVCMQRRVCQKC